MDENVDDLYNQLMFERFGNLFKPIGDLNTSSNERESLSESLTISKCCHQITPNLTEAKSVRA